jgi:hypothetical protein
MKFLLSTLFLAVSAVGALPPNLEANMQVEDEFFAWMKEHEKAYENTSEMLHRMEVWIDNHGAWID